MKIGKLTPLLKDARGTELPVISIGADDFGFH